MTEASATKNSIPSAEFSTTKSAGERMTTALKDAALDLIPGKGLYDAVTASPVKAMDVALGVADFIPAYKGVKALKKVKDIVDISNKIEKEKTVIKTISSQNMDIVRANNRIPKEEFIGSSKRETMAAYEARVDAKIDANNKILMNNDKISDTAYDNIDAYKKQIDDTKMGAAIDGVLSAGSAAGLAITKMATRDYE